MPETLGSSGSSGSSVSPESSPLILIMLTSSIVITDASGVSSEILPKLNPIYAPLSIFPSPTPTLKVTLVGSFAFKVIRFASCTYQFVLLLSIHANSAVLSTSEVSVALTSYTAPFFRVTFFCFRFTRHASVPAFVIVTVALFSVKSHFPSAGLLTSPDQPSSPFEKSPFFNRFVPSGSSSSFGASVFTREILSIHTLCCVVLLPPPSAILKIQPVSVPCIIWNVFVTVV